MAPPRRPVPRPARRADPDRVYGESAMVAAADPHRPDGPRPGAGQVPDRLDPEQIGDEPEVIGGKKSSLRRCIGTGGVKVKDLMVRFVVGPDGDIVPDVEETLPGRGLWLTAEGPVVEKAVARNAFAKAARRAVKVDRDLAARVVTLLRRRTLDLIGLARGGGGAVAGFEKVQAALKADRVGTRGSVGLWLEASDGAADGRAKLAPVATSYGLDPVMLFDRFELGRALGREEAVHVVLADGPLAGRLRREIRRIGGLTGVQVKGLTRTGMAPDSGERFNDRQSDVG